MKEFDEKSPLLINEKRETTIQFGENSKTIEIPKNLWILIIKHLPLKEIGRLSLLNKKFNQLINQSTLIWNTLSENYKNSLIDNREEYKTLILKNDLPSNIGNWRCQMHEFKVVHNLNSPKYCKEKKEFIKKKIANERKTALDHQDEKNIKLMGGWGKFVELHFLSIPFFLFATVILLQLKILLGLEKLKLTLCLVPFLSVGLVYFIQFLFLFYYSRKRWGHLYFWNSFETKKTPHFLFCSIFCLTTFFVLLGLKLDGAEINWNIVASFLDLSFLVLFLLMFFLHKKIFKRGDYSFIPMYFIGSLFICFSILVHLSVLGFFEQQKRWVFTMIPVMIFDGGALIILISFCFVAFRVRNYKKIFFNSLIVLGFLSFIVGVIFLFLHLKKNRSNLIYFLLFDATLFCLCTVDLLYLFKWDNN